jgi:membrane protease YdiL (CAAX protease family)
VAVTPAAAVLAFIAMLVLLAGFWAWLIAAARAAIPRRLFGESAATRITAFLQSLNVPAQLPLITWNPRKPVPWDAIDLLIVIGLYLFGSAAAAMIVEDLASTVVTIGSHVVRLSHDELLIIASLLVSLAILAIGLPLISFRTGATPRDFGLSSRDFGNDVKLGLIGFVMLAPPTYAIQGLLVSFWQESKHPLVEMFKEQPSNTFFAIVFVSAAVVAPLFEEFVFRVLLQGFLEKILAHPYAKSQPTVAPQVLPPDSLNDNQDLAVAPILPPDNNPYASPQTDTFAAVHAENAESVEFPETCPRSSWLAILISSAIFAALHYSHGPDWIPLFFLALGLGYLYQRTHRLVPSLVVHSLLNALSMWGLWVQVKSGP